MMMSRLMRSSQALLLAAATRRSSHCRNALIISAAGYAFFPTTNFGQCEAQDSSAAEEEMVRQTFFVDENKTG